MSYRCRLITRYMPPGFYAFAVWALSGSANSNPTRAPSMWRFFRHAWDIAAWGLSGLSGIGLRVQCGSACPASLRLFIGSAQHRYPGAGFQPPLSLLNPLALRGMTV